MSQSPPKEHLPNGWCWASLEQIASIQGGIQKGKKRKGTEHLIEIPYLRVANVQRGFLDLHDVKTILATEKEIEQLCLEHGDILLNEGGDRDKLGRGWVWEGQIARCVHQNHVFRARLYLVDFLPRFFSLYANSIGQRYFFGEGKQTTNLASLNLTKLRRFPVPVAPVLEQKRVLAELESYLSRLDAATEGLKRVEANLKRYRASALKAAVEGRLVPTEAELARREGRDYEPASVLLERILKERRRCWEESELAKMKAKGKVPANDKWKSKYKEPIAPDVEGLPELPEGWCWASLEAITSSERIICYGILMPKQHIPNGVPYVKVKDMRSGTLDIPSLQRTTPEIAAKFPRSVLRGGDLLIAIRGTYGRVVTVPESLEGGNITQDSARLDFSNDLSTGFAKLFLLSPQSQEYFRRIARGVAVKGVNIRDLREVPVALPPRPEQTRILEFTDELLSEGDSTRTLVSKSLGRIQRLRQAILKWAFEGKLVDQDPDDEPASVLLERIRQERQQAAPKKRPRRRKSSAKS